MTKGAKLVPTSTFREIRYLEKKRNILNKAAPLFAKKGYNEVMIEEIGEVMTNFIVRGLSRDKRDIR